MSSGCAAVTGTGSRFAFTYVARRSDGRHDAGPWTGLTLWLLKVGGFDERLGAGTSTYSAEDLDLYYRLLLAGATVYYVPDVIVFHERQSAQRRLSSRRAYGFGLGAFCAMWARRRDAYAGWMFACWCAGRVSRLLKSAVRGRWRGIREEVLMLRGAAAGVGYGCSLDGGTP